MHYDLHDFSPRCRPFLRFNICTTRISSTRPWERFECIITSSMLLWTLKNTLELGGWGESLHWIMHKKELSGTHEFTNFIALCSVYDMCGVLSNTPTFLSHFLWCKYRNVGILCSFSIHSSRRKRMSTAEKISHFSAARTPDNKFIIISHTAHSNPTDRLKTLHGFFSSAPRHNRAADDWTAAVILYYTYIFFRDSTAAVREDSNNIIRSFWPPWKWKIISTLFFPSSILLFSAAQHSKNGEECRGKEESEQNGEENTSKHFVDHKTLHFFSTHNNLHSLLSAL